MVEKPTSWLAALWFGSGSLALLAQWNFQAWLTQANTILLTIGGTLILLYQRKLAADRAAETNGEYRSLKAQINDLLKQRDHEQQRADRLVAQITELADLIEKRRCVFPNPDGSARCSGKEFPPL